MTKLFKRIPLLWMLMLFLANPVFATTGTTGLPWEAPLQTLQNSISGPVAVLIAIIALAAIGVTLIGAPFPAASIYITSGTVVHGVGLGGSSPVRPHGPQIPCRVPWRINLAHAAGGGERCHGCLSAA